MNALQPVLTAEAMREADRYTIEEFGIPGFTLMESAGREAAAVIETAVGPVDGKSVAVYCGRGNNGGDGLVIARYLYDRGARIRVFLLGDDLSPDSASHLSLLRKLRQTVGEGPLEILPMDDARRLPPADVHVDALLGTGLTKDLREPVLGIVAWLNDQAGFKVAVDIPTGLQTDLGRRLGAAFRADLTVTMGALKSGLCLHDGPATAGRVEVVPIGIPAFALRASVERGASGCAWLTGDEWVRRLLPSRATDANKYSVGLA
ncbi:MAG: NAD(P)H-hydrate epimerase, partial [Rhodothermales bacterium]